MKRIIILILIIIVIKKLLNVNKKIKFISIDIKGYSDLKKDLINSFTKGGIPKIIIKTSWHKRDKFPEIINDVLKKTEERNPGYQIYYFDDDEVDQFMREFGNYNDLDVYSCYRKLVPGAFKADLFRACCLYKYGGCYSDIGHIFLKGIDSFCADANIILVSDAKIMDFVLFRKHDIMYTGIHNALMCSVPEHPFFKEIIEQTCKNVSNNYYGENSLDVTGPTMIGKVFNCYFGDECNNENINKLQYGMKDYGCDRCKVKILKLVIKLDKNIFIQDYNNNDLIKIKFDDYYYVMYYSKNTPKYGDLWNNKQIYAF